MSILNFLIVPSVFFLVLLVVKSFLVVEIIKFRWINDEALAYLVLY